ncbi:hypothetical protein, partial [Nocardioides sp. IC4_145]|uniref:hypothetical protein n=1 Tax=Nocardioides sp. IC4_145 TaxID=2714037 RepID=UPI001A98F47D
PPLRDLAAKIAAELPEEPAAASTRPADVDEQIPEARYRSPAPGPGTRGPRLRRASAAEGRPLKALVGLAAAAIAAFTAGGITA